MELPCVCLEQVVKLFLEETSPRPSWSLSLRGGGGALPCLASVWAASLVGVLVAFHCGAFFCGASLLGVIWRPSWHPPSVALHLVVLEKTTLVLLHRSCSSACAGGVRCCAVLEDTFPVTLPRRSPSSACAGDVQCCATPEELLIMPAGSSWSPSSPDDEGGHHHHLCS